MALVIKAYLNKHEKLPMEIRRFSVDENVLVSYLELHEIISRKFPRLKDGKFILQWKDVDGDLVAFTSDEELKDALTSMKDDTLKVYIKGEDEFAEHQSPIKQKMRKCQDEEFAPPPQFRRWMRRFMRRWHAKVIEQDEDSCKQLLDKDLLKMGSKNKNGSESSEESGASSEERKTVKDRKKTHENERKINICMQRKVEKCTALKHPDDKKGSGADTSPKPEKKKKQVRIIITSNDDKEPTEPKKSVRKDKKAKKENADDASSGAESPIVQIKRKLKTLKMDKTDKSDESGWTVLEEDPDILLSTERKVSTDTTKLEADLITIQTSLERMLEIGFTNEGDWLFHLLQAVDGSIPKAVETIRRNKKAAKLLKRNSSHE